MWTLERSTVEREYHAWCIWRKHGNNFLIMKESLFYHCLSILHFISMLIGFNLSDILNMQKEPCIWLFWIYPSKIFAGECFSLSVIPGPKEPSLHIKSFLEPFVKEMMLLWRGVSMNTAQDVQTLVWGALLCCGCDVPAARKVCGLLPFQ